eukprot:IDg6221t1
MLYEQLASTGSKAKPASVWDLLALSCSATTERYSTSATTVWIYLQVYICVRDRTGAIAALHCEGPRLVPVPRERRPNLLTRLVKGEVDLQTDGVPVPWNGEGY